MCIRDSYRPFFEGDKKRIYLNKKYLKFIKFVAKYGQEMICSQNRDEGLYQMGMDCFGLSEMIYNQDVYKRQIFKLWY